MNKVQKAKALVMGFAVLLLMNSCVEFFSTSWGEVFKRDPKNVKVTTGNVDALLETAKGDKDLSKAILDKIHANIDPEDNSAEADTLRRAAIKAANQAVDIGSLLLENVGSLKDAADGKGGDAFETFANNILKEMDPDVVIDIGKKTTEILKDKVEIKPVDPKVALENAGTVEVPVSTTGGGTGTITIDVKANGTGTATIDVGGGAPVEYPCTINDNGTITLTGAGNGNVDVNLGYEIDDDEGTLKLTDLDHIKNVGLKEESGDSDKDSIPSFPGMPVFEEGFIDDSVTDSDLTLLVMTLVLAKAEKETEGDLKAYLDKTLKNKNLETGEGELDDDEKVIAAVVNTMIERGDDTSKLTDALKDLLEGD
jgi:hypothetical protein